MIVSDSFIIQELQHLGRISNNLRTALMTFRLLPPIMGKVFQQHPVSHSVTPADTRESHYIRLLAADRWWLELNREAARSHRNLSHWPLSDSKSQCQAITQAYLDAMRRALNVPAVSMHPSHLRSPTIVNTAPIKAESRYRVQQSWDVGHNNKHYIQPKESCSLCGSHGALKTQSAGFSFFF